MKRVLAVFLCVNFFCLPTAMAYGLFQLGEWESSGDLPPPYIPKGPLKYHCTIEVSLSKGSASFIGRVYRDFNTADFAEMGGAWYELGSAEKWTIHPDMKPDDVRALKSLASGQAIALSFSPNGDGSEQAVLTAFARLTLPGETLSSSAVTEAPRANRLIYTRATIYKQVPGVPSKSMHVSVEGQCEEQP